jgi:hypothetical protein
MVNYQLVQLRQAILLRGNNNMAKYTKAKPAKVPRVMQGKYVSSLKQKSKLKVKKYS